MKTTQTLPFTHVALVVVVFTGCSTTADTMHDSRHEHAAASAPASAAKPYPLDVCLVSGEALDSMGGPVTKIHDGQEVKFCCKSCPADFDANPDKYMAKLSQ